MKMILKKTDERLCEKQKKQKTQKVTTDERYVEWSEREKYKR